MNTAEIIRTIRERAGLSRYRLEKMVGASHGHITRWEEYGVCPRMDMFIAIVEACDHEIIIKPKSTGYYNKNTTKRRCNWR